MLAAARGQVVSKDQLLADVWRGTIVEDNAMQAQVSAGVRIWDSPLSPTAGQGALKGQMLAAPVKILTVRRVALAAP